MNNKKAMIESAIQRIDENATSRQIEAGKRYFAALEGDLKSKHFLQEGISTSDIPALLQPAINVNFLTRYATAPTVWNQIAEEETFPVLGQLSFGDFDIDASTLPPENDGKTYVNGGLPGVAEYGEYPAATFTTTQLNASLRKNGLRIRVSWESMMKTGDFRILDRAAAKFALYAAREEDLSLAQQFVTTAGAVNATNFPAGRQITTTGLQDLDIPALQNALQLSQNAMQAGGKYGVSGWKLVYGIGLSQIVNQIFNSTGTIRRTIGNDQIELSIASITGGVTPVLFDALGAVGGATVAPFWFLIPDGPRPAFIEGFLEGHRAPLISVKDSGHFALSGGAVPAREGSFDEDDIQTRVRHVVQAAAVDLTGALYSDGVD